MFLFSIIPVQFKRLVLVSTIYHKAIEEGVYKGPTIQVINKCLNLSTREEAIHSVLVLRDFIWGGVDLRNIVRVFNIDTISGRKLSVPEINELSRLLISNVPPWLRYDRVRMESDIMHFINCGEHRSIRKENRLKDDTQLTTA